MEAKTEANRFTCSICGYASSDICVTCTRDACSNHLCQRCRRCSDCCTCDMPVTAESQSEAKSAPVEYSPLEFQDGPICDDAED